MKIPVIAFKDSSTTAYNFDAYEKFDLTNDNVSHSAGAEKNIFCLNIASVDTIKT